MKKYIKYAAALIMAACTLPSCSSDEFVTEYADGNGAVTLSTRIATSDGSEVAGPVHVRIYRVNGEENELIRHYTDEGIPETLQLLAGNYKAAVTVGEMVDAAFDQKYYEGEESFTIEAGKPTPVQVDCYRLNIAASVNFDASVAENFTEAKVWVAMATRDDIERLGTKELAELEYTQTSTGYFMLPEGITSLIYKFEGTHKEPTMYGDNGVIIKSGMLENLEAGANAKLGFRFSPDAPGFVEIFNIYVDYSTEDFRDVITWSDIEITGSVDLNAANSYVPGTTTPVTYTITSVTGAKAVTLRVDNKVRYTIVHNGSQASECPAGVTVNMTDDKAATVTLGDEFFKLIGGGDHSFRFSATDNASGVLDQDTDFKVQGLLPVTEADYDLWHNTVTLKALVLDGSQSVNITLGSQNKSATAGADGIFSATFEPEWVSTSNGSKPSYYLPKAGTGVFAGNDYDCAATINGINYNGAFAIKGGDTITNGNMEGNLSCFTTNNSNTTFWGSGNNDIKNGLCTAGSFTGMQGSQCARMKAESTLGILASGNLFTGTFYMEGTTGYVGFGQKYTYSARPKSLKFKYHAQVGNVNIAKTALIPEGQPDQSSIYVCIIDWSARHTVSSGTGTPTGMWDPSEVTEMDGCGKIIAYGQMYIDTTTSGSAMVEGEIPLRYYDTECNAPTGNYTIIIACSTSRYGDYMNGCDSNVLHVDDFRWGY